MCMTSIKQHPHGAVVIMAQPISVVKDPIFLNMLKKAFQEQLRVSVLLDYLPIPPYLH